MSFIQVIRGCSRRLLTAALVGGALLASEPAGAQGFPNPFQPRPANGPAGPKKPPPVNMVVEVGHGNFTRGDQKTPIRITLDNNDVGITGRLEVRDFRNHVTETLVELPAKAHKQYTLVAPLSPNALNDQAAAGEVLLLTGRRVIAREPLKPRFLQEEGMMALSCTGDGAGLQFLGDSAVGKTREEQDAEDGAGRFLRSGRGDALKVTHLSPQDMPRQWVGYRPLHVVAVNGRAWSGMDDEQKRALRIWIERGGTAVLCGESTTEWRDVEGQALAGVTPVDLRSVPALEECVLPWSRQPYRTEAGTLLTVSGPLNPGADTLKIAREDGRPLIVPRRAALGRVLWLGFDPFRETLRNWPGYENFWRRLLADTRRDTTTPPIRSLDSMETVTAAVNALPRLPAPPMPVIIAFGVAYAVIFGPLNIWMLRRLRRTVRSWLFMPALAVVMTLVVLLAGQSWGKGRTVLNSVTILVSGAGSRTAREESLIGLFSPTNRSFDLASDDPAPELHDLGSADPQDRGQTVELDWPGVQQDGGVKWNAVALQLYATRLLSIERPRDLGGSFQIRLDGSLRGAVVNGSSIALRNAYLQLDNRIYPLGDLGPCKQATVNPRGWSQQQPAHQGTGGAGGVQENGVFTQAVRELWTSAREQLVTTRDARRDLWLVAECPDFRTGLEVAGAPFSNQRALLIVRADRVEPNGR